MNLLNIFNKKDKLLEDNITDIKEGVEKEKPCENCGKMTVYTYCSGECKWVAKREYKRKQLLDELNKLDSAVNGDPI